ncbi:Uncharacterized protein FWK35_00032924, partial [Aphis craccivora]
NLKVEVLETNSKNNNLNSAMANQYIDSNFLSLFPIKDKDEFLSVESNIVNEVGFVLKPESFIKSIGGCGLKIILQGCYKKYLVMNLLLSLRGLDVICSSKKKDLSLISTKYFRRVLKAEQQKVNLNVTSIVNSNSINCVKTNITNNDLPLKLSVSVKDPMIPECLLNTLNFETVQSNNFNLGFDAFNDPTITNHDPMSPMLEVDLQKNVCITDKLRLLIIKHKVSHNFCNSLLQLLKSEGLDVPKDIRTLMKTPKLHDIVDISGGYYIHLGLRNMLLPILIKNNAQIYIKSHVLEIGINIDGLPVSKSSKSQIWPALISILNFKELKENVIPIGIFHGFQKPISIEEFLNPLIIDLLEVLDNGLTVNGLFFTVNISNVSCDSPAKAFLLNVKGHNAYFGCTLCIEEGTYLEHRMTYPGLDATLRTDESFRSKKDEDYHKGNSPLVCLPINIINTVVLDYMHNVCLGVVKKLVEFWVKGNKQFLKKFVNDYSALYGSQYISYNVHSLIHLPFYVLLHGPLDNFSCFRYENYLQEIKKSIKSIKYPLQEIFNRIVEKQKMYDTLPTQLHKIYPVLSNEIILSNPSPLFNINDKLFEKITLELTSTIINVLKEKDRYIMLTNNTLVMVQHIVEPKNEPLNLIVKQFISYSEFTNTPESSFKMGVYMVDTSKMSKLYRINLTDIKYKCFFIRLSDNLALISTLCHLET